MYWKKLKNIKYCYKYSFSIKQNNVSSTRMYEVILFPLTISGKIFSSSVVEANGPSHSDDVYWTSYYVSCVSRTIVRGDLTDENFLLFMKWLMTNYTECSVYEIQSVHESRIREHIINTRVLSGYAIIRLILIPYW